MTYFRIFICFMFWNLLLLYSCGEENVDDNLFTGKPEECVFAELDASCPLPVIYYGVKGRLRFGLSLKEVSRLFGEIECHSCDNDDKMYICPCANEELYVTEELVPWNKDSLSIVHELLFHNDSLAQYSASIFFDNVDMANAFLRKKYKYPFNTIDEDKPI